jgi:hypothetical protein
MSKRIILDKFSNCSTSACPGQTIDRVPSLGGPRVVFVPAPGRWRLYGNLNDDAKVVGDYCDTCHDIISDRSTSIWVRLYVWVQDPLPLSEFKEAA